MNRQIKFRMWNYVKDNPTASKMFYDTFEVMACLEQQISFDLDKHPLGYDHVSDGNVFMQFTGLTDKNGVDVFERDKLINPKGEIGTVIWDEAGFYLECIRKNGVVFMIPLTKGFMQNKEVIGNEFETTNP
jgi:hypothetical protein